MEDFMYIGIIAVSFLLTWGLMRLCEALGEFKSGDNL
jgi:hypothetical protein